MSCVENYFAIRKELEKAGRGGVLLLPVSKTVEAPAIRELYNAGVRDFGENRIEVLTPKAEALPKDIRWHFIGRLQSNKVRKILKVAQIIHSVDSIELVERISRIAGDLKLLTTAASIIPGRISTLTPRRCGSGMTEKY